MRTPPSCALGAAVLAAALAASAPALADHVSVPMEVGTGECVPAVVTARWSGQENPYEDTARLVVRTADGTRTAPLGESLRIDLEDMTVPPTATAPGEIHYRVWVGDEHHYANPPLTDPEAMLAHIEAGGSPADADAPGAAWAVASVPACPDDRDAPGPDPSHPADPTPPEPADPAPTAQPEPEEGEGNGEGPDHGGAPAGWLADLPRAPEGMSPGQWCRAEDRLTTVYAYTTTSALQCQDVNGWRWIQVHGPQDLVEPSAGHGREDKDRPEPSPRPEPAQDTPAPPSRTAPAADGGLPVTGAALLGPVLAGMLSLGAGTAVLWAVRRPVRAEAD